MTDPVRDLISALRSSHSDLTSLLSLLIPPLDSLGLLTPTFRRLNATPLPTDVHISPKHISAIQQAILQHVAPVWLDALADEGAALLLDQYFCPDAFSFASTAAGQVSCLAYSNILSLPLTEYSVRLLARLTKEYPIDRLHVAVLANSDGQDARSDARWEDLITNVVTVPAKVANALAGSLKGKMMLPAVLEQAAYFEGLSVRCEVLMHSSSSSLHAKRCVASVTVLLARLVKLGVFPPAPPTFRSQPSFFGATLSTIRAHLHGANWRTYSEIWSGVILSLPSTFVLRAVLTSLSSYLSTPSSGLDPSPSQRGLVKQEATLLKRFAGQLGTENGELWECVTALFLSRDWDAGRARIFICWLAGCDGDDVNEEALTAFLEKVMEMWASPEHIKHSLLGRHQYITSLLLITTSYFPPSSRHHQDLAFNSAFISAIGKYIEHLDSAIRRCGMLAAEVVAHRAGKKLDFGDWEGDDTGKHWARELRRLLEIRDIDAAPMEVDEPLSEIKTEENVPAPDVQMPSCSPAPRPPLKEPKLVSVIDGDDSDDSMIGYASPTSSRSASPTPSELDEIEKDPTVHVGVKKVLRPVYLAQLGEMIRGSSVAKDANLEADKTQMALNYGEELIRRKRNYGTELDENAVNLAYGFISLQNNYESLDFDPKRQLAVNALVACCPRKVAPCLIEEFFKNQYSTNQRFVMLNALALGARELASLPLPPSAISPLSKDRTAFPSKTLPAGKHQKYLSAGNETDSVQELLQSISLAAIKSGQDVTPEKAPKFVRERRLRVQQPAKVTEVTNTSSRTIETRRPQNETTFTQVAAEFFIVPLINTFWLFLRDEQSREERTAHNEALFQYRGAGTGLILNPFVLTHFLASLAVLVHAARNAPEWLAVVAPDALELAVTLGTRPVSRQDGDEEEEGNNTGSSGSEVVSKQAAVLVAALELALVVLDGCLELDDGRSIGLEHTGLLLGTGEWAGGVFALLEKGVRVPGGGGAQEARLRGVVAGVLLKVDALTSKWRRSMVNFVV